MSCYWLFFYWRSLSFLWWLRLALFRGNTLNECFMHWFLLLKIPFFRWNSGMRLRFLWWMSLLFWGLLFRCQKFSWGMNLSFRYRSLWRLRFSGGLWLGLWYSNFWCIRVIKLLFMWFWSFLNHFMSFFLTLADSLFWLAFVFLSWFFLFRGLSCPRLNSAWFSWLHNRNRFDWIIFWG